MGVFTVGMLLGAVMGAGMATALSNSSSAVNQRDAPVAAKTVNLQEQTENVSPEWTALAQEPDEDVALQSADAFFRREAKVPKVELRFDNSCFWEKQKEMQQFLMANYVNKLTSATQSLTQSTEATSKAMSTTSVSKSLVSLYEAGPSATADVHLKFQTDCQKWVAQSTDATWHAVHEADRNNAVEKYFGDDFVSHIYGYSVGGQRAFHGKEVLKNLIRTKLSTFPDLKIRILNTICTPAVHDELGLLGFFTTMPDLSAGTMKGPMNVTLPQEDGSFVEVVIPASHNKVAYAGNAVTFVAPDQSGNWQYQGEWVMHGEMEMFAQMNALGAIAPHASGTAQKIVDELAPHVESCSFPDLWYGDDQFAKVVKAEAQA